MNKCTSNEGKTAWPLALTVHQDIRTDDMYADGLIGPIGEGSFYAFIDGRDIVVEVQVDPIRYDIDEFMRAFPHENTLQGGVRLASFSEQGRATMGKNEGSPDLIVDETRYTMGFDIEANFYSRLPAVGVYEFRSAMGNRYIHFTVRRTRTHQRNIKMCIPNIGSVRGQQLPYVVASTQLAIQNNESLDPVQYGRHHPVRYQNH
jgi:hypothetical protein